MKTVQDVIDYLSRFPTDAPVLVRAGNIDFWGRIPLAAPELQHWAQRDVQHCEYHGAFVEIDDDTRNEDEALLTAVIL